MRHSAEFFKLQLNDSMKTNDIDIFVCDNNTENTSYA